MAQSRPPEYSYRPLQGTEIRLIALKPYDEAVGTVECSLRQVPLGSMPFDSLSYVWGDPAITEPIVLDGRPFQVTTNLARCLRVLTQRRAHHITQGFELQDHLWVDAVCINQHDIDERNAQVLRMHDIYSTASAVLAWLGEAAGDTTRLAIEWLAEASVTGGGAVFSEAGSTQASHLEGMVRQLMDPSEPSTLNGINDLFGRDWWKRMWVVQEAVRAQRLFLICGDHSLSYGSFAAAWKSFYQSFAAHAERSVIEAETVIDGSPSIIFNIKSAAAERHGGGGGLALAELLRFTRRARALQPQDKVYALLGISTDMARGEIAPDYRLTPREVFAMTIREHVTQHGTLDILDGCEFRNAGGLGPRGWPSWIPQWTDVDERPTEFSWTPGFFRGANLYDAAGGRKLEAGTWSVDNERGEFRLPGVLVDTITALSDMAALSSKTHKNEDPEAVLRRWMELFPDPAATYHPTRETVGAAFRRTVVVDRRVGIGQPTEGYSRGFAVTLPWETPSAAAAAADQSLQVQDAITGFMMAADLRRLALTSADMMALVPGSARLGDEIAVLVGGQFPYVVRRVDAEDAGHGGHDREDGRITRRLVGEAYVHGIMDGEALLREDPRQVTLV